MRTFLIFFVCCLNLSAQEYERFEVESNFDPSEYYQKTSIVLEEVDISKNRISFQFYVDGDDSRSLFLLPDRIDKRIFGKYTSVYFQLDLFLVMDDTEVLLKDKTVTGNIPIAIPVWDDFHKDNFSNCEFVLKRSWFEQRLSKVEIEKLPQDAKIGVIVNLYRIEDDSYKLHESIRSNIVPIEYKLGN